MRFCLLWNLREFHFWGTDMKTHAQTLSYRLAVLKRYAFPVIAAVTLTLFLSASVRAGTVTFDDLSETLTPPDVTGFGSPSRATFNCPSTGESITVGTHTFSGEGCTATINGPLGNTGFTLSGPCDTYLTGCVTFIWASPGGPGTTREISDVVRLQQTAGVFTVTFVSDPDTGSGEGFGFTCAQVAALGPGLDCGPQENGSSQLAADITWTGTTTTVDHIKFMSDPVPEPASLALVGSGLLAIAAFRRKRLA
jgi:hypothetical protein